MRLRAHHLPLLIGAIALAGCGGTKTVTAPAPAGLGSPKCAQGIMGGCIPRGETVAPAKITGALIPDVSEYQSCALHSEAIFRVYEAGTGKEDATAVCHAQELHRLHAWAAVYAFLRPGNCSSEASATTEIVKSLPVEVQAVIADAEVSLPPGCVRSFLSTVRAAGWPAVEYTCPGCGVEQIKPVWIAAYPFRPAGSWVAHQFSDNWPCRGVQGDCSVNEGILSIRKTKPAPFHRLDLEARRRTLRRVLLAYGCRRRVKQHERLGPRCRRWFAEGQHVNQRLKEGR